MSQQLPSPELLEYIHGPRVRPIPIHRLRVALFTAGLYLAAVLLVVAVNVVGRLPAGNPLRNLLIGSAYLLMPVYIVVTIVGFILITVLVACGVFCAGSLLEWRHRLRLTRSEFVQVIIALTVNGLAVLTSLVTVVLIVDGMLLGKFKGHTGP